MGLLDEHGARQLQGDVREVRKAVMRTFIKEKLERFLMAIDQTLRQPVEFIVIGGTAAALHYGVTRATHDIETWTTVQAELAAAAERARLATCLNIPVERLFPDQVEDVARRLRAPRP